MGTIHSTGSRFVPSAVRRPGETRSRPTKASMHAIWDDSHLVDVALHPDFDKALKKRSDVIVEDARQPFGAEWPRVDLPHPEPCRPLPPGRLAAIFMATSSRFGQDAQFQSRVGRPGQCRPELSTRRLRRPKVMSGWTSLQFQARRSIEIGASRPSRSALRAEPARA